MKARLPSRNWAFFFYLKPMKLTIKDLADLLNNSKDSAKEDFLQHLVGKYVIARFDKNGVHFGKVEAISEKGVRLSNARRLWYHTAKEGAWYEAVAKYGIRADSKISEIMDSVIILESPALYTIASDDCVSSVLAIKPFKNEQ